MKSKIARSVFLWALSVSMVAGLFAQEAVPGLQDLIGVRGRDAEPEMVKRGYTWIRTEKTDSEAYGYWRDNRGGRCLAVRTSEGRWESIVFVPSFSCESEESSDSGAGYDRTDEFETVCGVAFGGKIHRNRCKVVDYYREDTKKMTDVHFPDQVMRLRWQNDRKVAVHIEGQETQRVEYRAAVGDINYFMDDKTYFYTADQEKAKLEVANLE